MIVILAWICLSGEKSNFKQLRATMAKSFCQQCSCFAFKFTADSRMQWQRFIGSSSGKTSWPCTECFTVRLDARLQPQMSSYCCVRKAIDVCLSKGGKPSKSSSQQPKWVFD